MPPPPPPPPPPPAPPPFWLLLFLCFFPIPSSCFPLIDPLSDYDPIAELLHRGNGTGCGPCDPEQCPVPAGCRAGLTPDPCGCCLECGNQEGQACDPGPRSVHHGLCGTGLRCLADPGPGVDDADEPLCVCMEQDAMCGSDGRTFRNMCRLREESFTQPSLRSRGKGPCKTVPVIKVPPQSQVSGSGCSLVLRCEVFAFPMALVEWRKEGQEAALPGDDPRISVQSRGGPLKYELSSWLQIEGAEPEHSGTYRCVARNNLGSVSSWATLGVLSSEEMSAHLTDSLSEIKEMLDYDQNPGDDQDYY